MAAEQPAGRLSVSCAGLSSFLAEACDGIAPVGASAAEGGTLAGAGSGEAFDCFAASPAGSPPTETG